ncbi:hypothetical protein [Methylocucumis oryzae]|uniref:Uncharacterized protein n=1 Tax=Methylocucumis oryzae TaxID=1632867 RepID=A0A0F3IMW3_9GAMM|nr:hypothetical protein [Methylocucumis oryzae]KJV08060.1 hypothetical protein VZ94_00425 [Methylocucumis oryzae]
MWSALGTHFGVKKEKGDKIPAYKRIPEGARLECLSLLARLSVDDLVTMTQNEFEQAINDRIALLPKPEAEPVTLDEKIQQIVDAKIKAIQGELMPRVVLSDDQVLVSKTKLKQALRRACGEKITIRLGHDLIVKVNEDIYQQSEHAFFETLNH